MLNAAEARANAAGAAERNEQANLATAETIIAEKIEPAIVDAVDEGLTSMAIQLEGCTPAVADIVYAQLAEAGFDVAVAAMCKPGSKVLDINCMTIYWTKDRGGEPGKIQMGSGLLVSGLMT